MIAGCMELRRRKNRDSPVEKTDTLQAILGDEPKRVKTYSEK